MLADSKDNNDDDNDDDILVQELSCTRRRFVPRQFKKQRACPRPPPPPESPHEDILFCQKLTSHQVINRIGDGFHFHDIGETVYRSTAARRALNYDYKLRKRPPPPVQRSIQDRMQMPLVQYIERARKKERKKSRERTTTR